MKQMDYQHKKEREIKLASLSIHMQLFYLQLLDSFVSFTSLFHASFFFLGKYY